MGSVLCRRLPDVPLRCPFRVGAQATNRSDARSCCQVSYFVVQDVVEIIQENLLVPEVWPQENAGAVALQVRLCAADEQD